MPSPVRPTRRKSSLPKLIEKYYADLADLARQNVLFEMGLHQPFHSLLAAAGKEHGWTLIAEQEKKVGGETIRPEGTFKDEMNLVRGYWESVPIRAYPCLSVALVDLVFRHEDSVEIFACTELLFISCGYNTAGRLARGLIPNRLAVWLWPHQGFHLAMYASM
jgi:hypothetical protein